MSDRMGIPEHAIANAEVALYEYAQKRWGWGGDEYPDIVDAVEVVINALAAQRGAVEGLVAGSERVHIEGLERENAELRQAADRPQP